VQVNNVWSFTSITNTLRGIVFKQRHDIFIGLLVCQATPVSAPPPTYLYKTNYTEQNLSWEADSHPAN